MLRGLPDLPATYAYMPWESQKPLQIQIAELSKSERRHNFCFPLIGHRDSLAMWCKAVLLFWTHVDVVFAPTYDSDARFCKHLDVCRSIASPSSLHGS